MPETQTPIEPDFSKAWVRGEEYIGQEGSSYWTRIREGRGWSRDDVYELTDYQLCPAAQELLESEWGPSMPDLHELILLAHLYGERPGDLLNECFEQKGRELLAGD